jgi:hypothetical protein
LLDERQQRGGREQSVEGLRVRCMKIDAIRPCEEQKQPWPGRVGSARDGAVARAEYREDMKQTVETASPVVSGDLPEIACVPAISAGYNGKKAQFACTCPVMIWGSAS